MGSRLDRITDWEALAKEAGYRVKEMARLANVDRRQLLRFFEDRVGHSLRFWLQRLRLRLAVELLVKGQSGTEIAGKLGFNHESSFYQFFLRTTGETPLAYTKSRSSDARRSTASLEADGDQIGLYRFASSAD